VLVYTVGHSTRSLSEFLALLKRYGVKVLVDVRRFPTSRKFPHFCRDALEGSLKSAGERYVWMGELLGGFRKGGYQGYMKTPGFEQGVMELRALANGGGVAIMCAELLWFRCHRRYIADRLIRLGCRVVHIVDEKRTYEHRGSRGKNPERREA